jgi:hypothetical protein
MGTLLSTSRLLDFSVASVVLVSVPALRLKLVGGEGRFYALRTMVAGQGS